MLGKIANGSRFAARRLVLRSRIPQFSILSKSLRYPVPIVTNESIRLFSAVLEAERPVERAVKNVYTRMTQLEHILLRPGMYIGQAERLPPAPCWVLETPPLPTATKTEFNASRLRVVSRQHSLSPALIKIFDEILVNASDNRMRHPDSFSRIDVTINPGSATQDPVISIVNDGPGIPIEIHETENLYLPELLFGHLPTGSNFDDKEKRVTGGRHGFGAKLTNIFSKEFTVETVDSSRGLRYVQTWRDNMRIMEEAVITYTTDTDYTRVSFIPDIPRLTGIATETATVPVAIVSSDINNDRQEESRQVFPMEEQDFAIMCRRVLDIAGCCASSGHVKVTLNGHAVSLPSFEAYSKLYRDTSSPPLRFTRVNDRWEVAVGVSETGSFESISFVNSIATTQGGTHVTSIVQQISKALSNVIAKKFPELENEVSPMWIRRQLFVTCNALIENPNFNSQTKEYLTSAPNTWGSECELSNQYLDQLFVAKEKGGTGIIEAVVQMARGRQREKLSRVMRGSPTKVNLGVAKLSKLEEARWAGTKEGSQCTLILTEGDSAKALAVAGLEVIGRERFGVFPLRGKLLNVRKAKLDAMMKNDELKALCAIVGLEFQKKYETSSERAKLRYGRIMLMTDQDNDGSHIKGLVMNFFRHFWPEMLKPPIDKPDEQPFLSSFITPLLKATLKSDKKEVLTFDSQSDFEEWRSSFEDPDDMKRWSLKYYKGLGTSTPAEAKMYFQNFDQHVRPFQWKSDADGDLLDMVFGVDRAADRRHWILETYDKTSTLVADPEDSNGVSFENFVNNELIHFSNADNIRSLPSVIDGLKPSQRKVLYACFKRNLKSEVKVAQLTGYCAEHTAYHHGEASLQSTIIGMAQDFVGSNNINLLAPQGQFGTRLEGGKDAASPRYIFTHLTSTARLLFPEEDDMLLDYREDDGQSVEPVFFCPSIPLILVNGSKGIGTGWSTSIFAHDPHDVIAYIRAKLDKSENLPCIKPWVRGFKGKFEKRTDQQGFDCIGKLEIIEDEQPHQKIHISELPVGMWTNNYRATLIKMREKDKILSFIEDHTTTTISFTITVTSEQLKHLRLQTLEKAFKLVTRLSTSNMNAFDAQNSIVKFDSAEQIADTYFPWRYDLYEDRKSVLQSELSYQAKVMTNKARFIQAVATGEIDLVRRSQTMDQTLRLLDELEYDDKSKLMTIRQNNALYKRRNATALDDAIMDCDNDSAGRYDYLLNMPIASLNAEKIKGLQRDAAKIEAELNELINTSPADLWRRDLDRLEAHLKYS